MNDAIRKILIVEDESITALDLRAVLSRLGYEIAAVVGSGEEAVRLAADTRPDLVLMDIHLRGAMDGISAAGEIRQRLDVPVVFLTAYGDDDTLQRARSSQPFGYLLKPFAERELQIAVEGALFRHSLERRLVENERWMAATLGSIGDGVIATGEDGRVRLMNPAAERLTGRSAADAVGHLLAEVLEVRGADAPGETAVEVRLRTAAGEEVPIERSTQPIHDPQGAVAGSVTIFRSIAERKRAEAAAASQARELARSNAELEQFAYVASHDLQEPLRMVGSYVQLLARRYQGKLDRDADEFIAYALDGVTRMRALIDDLLAYSRVGRGRPLAPTATTKALEQAVANLQASIVENAAIVTHDALPEVLGDETQLVQLFQNLIGNAIKFHGSEPPRVHVAAERDGSLWRFSCTDNGIGIEREYLDRIFVIFQRLHTRAKYPGTGIGLAICKRIVERHQGAIWLESTPGKGSTFFFTLPAV